MIKAFVKAQHLLVLRCDTGRLGTGLVVWVGLRVVKVSTFFAEMMAARTVAAAWSSFNWHSFCTLLVVLWIISHSFKATALQYSRTELLQLNTGVLYHLPAEYFIPPEIVTHSTAQKLHLLRLQMTCFLHQTKAASHC